MVCACLNNMIPFVLAERIRGNSSRQQNLTGTNFADREYFKGVVSTHGTYLGGVFVSASSGLKQVVIAVPIYSENNEESSPLLGIWIG
jgi:hypothetical protein